MQIALKLSPPLECQWTLYDKNGDIVARDSDYPDAVLEIIPHFYVGMHTQTIMRTTTTGDKGRDVAQQLKVSATTGKLSAGSADERPKEIIPRFDTLPAKKPHVVAPDNNIRTEE